MKKIFFMLLFMNFLHATSPEENLLRIILLGYQDTDKALQMPALTSLSRENIDKTLRSMSANLHPDRFILLNNDQKQALARKYGIEYTEETFVKDISAVNEVYLRIKDQLSPDDKNCFSFLSKYMAMPSYLITLSCSTPPHLVLIFALIFISGGVALFKSLQKIFTATFGKMYEKTNKFNIEKTVLITDKAKASKVRKKIFLEGLALLTVAYVLGALSYEMASYKSKDEAFFKLITLIF